MFFRVIGDSLRLFNQNIIKFLIIGLIIFAPLVALKAAFYLYTNGIAPYEIQAAQMQLKENPQDINAQMAIVQAENKLRSNRYDPMLAQAGSLALFILGILAFLLFMGSSTLLSNRIFQGEAVSYSEIFKGVVVKLPGLAFLAFLIYYGLFFRFRPISVFIFGAFGKTTAIFITSILPYLLIFIMVAFFSMSLPVYMLERVSPWAALKRGFKISYEHQLPMFVLLLIMYLLITLLTQALLVVGGMVMTNAVALLSYSTITNMIVPFVQALPVLVIYLYYRYILAEKQGVTAKTVDNNLEV
ncbi:MAG: hypothetical protein ACM3PP_08485 [Candidatus Saccharibacteria bacterium]